MADDNKNWIEALGSRLTERLWNVDKETEGEIVRRGRNGNLPPMTDEQMKQMKAYLADPAKYRSEQEAKSMDRKLLRDNLRLFDGIVEKQRHEMRKEAMESAAEMGLTPTWNGFRDDYGGRYNEFGERIN